jgi:hypothetical protein
VARVGCVAAAQEAEGRALRAVSEIIRQEARHVVGELSDCAAMRALVLDKGRCRLATLSAAAGP